MNLRLLYAGVMTLFALFTGFYAVMSLAFFFGEGRSEWFFPILITAIAILTLWTCIVLWGKRDALVLTGVSLAVVTALIGWIAIPPGTWEASFIAIVIAGLLGLGLLLGLFSNKVRTSLKKN